MRTPEIFAFRTFNAVKIAKLSLVWRREMWVSRRAHYPKTKKTHSEQSKYRQYYHVQLQACFAIKRLLNEIYKVEDRQDVQALIGNGMYWK